MKGRSRRGTWVELIFEVFDVCIISYYCVEIWESFSTRNERSVCVSGDCSVFVDYVWHIAKRFRLYCVVDFIICVVVEIAILGKVFCYCKVIAVN